MLNHDMLTQFAYKSIKASCFDPYRVRICWAEPAGLEPQPAEFVAFLSGITGIIEGWRTRTFYLEFICMHTLTGFS